MTALEPCCWTCPCGYGVVVCREDFPEATTCGYCEPPAFPMPCGRLDWHDQHEWTRHAHLGGAGEMVAPRTHRCTGRVLIEGGYWLDWTPGAEPRRATRKEDVGYAAIHGRLRAEWGTARRYACIECNGPACEWAYDGTDPDERTDTIGGYPLRYSLDLTKYQPRCKRCHATQDSGRPDKAPGRGPRGERAPKAKLTVDQVLEIRRRYAQGEKPRQLAVEYGVHRNSIHNIASGATWSHFDAAEDRTDRERREEVL